jgi:hypothetical protein
MVAEEPDRTPKEELPDCPECGARMALVRITPKLGGLPELHTFRCEECGEVMTNEV